MKGSRLNITLCCIQFAFRSGTPVPCINSTFFSMFRIPFIGSCTRSLHIRVVCLASFLINKTTIFVIIILLPLSLGSRICGISCFTISIDTRLAPVSQSIPVVLIMPENTDWSIISTGATPFTLSTADKYVRDAMTSGTLTHVGPALSGSTLRRVRLTPAGALLCGSYHSHLVPCL